MGPLRAICTSKQYIVVTEQFDTVSEPFHQWDNPSVYITSTFVNFMKVLGKGLGRIALNAGLGVRSKNVIGEIDNHAGARYCVWSIHTYLQDQIPENQLNGWIISEDFSTRLGTVNFRYDQWTCSYGMKLVDKTDTPLRMRLEFRTYDYPVTFCITDYQIVMFDDLASANAFVNSREFAKFPLGDETEGGVSLILF